ncbi:MAG TPA: OmpA family protein [Spirochaetota bacterium]|nr:OmpA family protein [Spirochaetota bacterium]
MFNKNILKIKLCCVCFLLLSGFLISAPTNAADTKNPDNITNIRRQIARLIKQANSNTIKAQRLFKEAAAASKARTEEIKAKLSSLRSKIKKYSQMQNVNQKGITKAANLAKSAEGLIKKYRYDKAETNINQALGYITTVPVISLKVSPNIFSPDGDGYADKLHIYTKVFKKAPVTNWQVTIYHCINKKGAQTNIPVKTASGTNYPPAHFAWSGILDDGKTKVDSGSTYQIQMTATDAKGGTGKSGFVKFKTDIFAVNTRRGLMIDISSIIFDLGKANIKPKYRPVIKKLYKKLAEYPQYTIAVEGHTDATGSAEFNKKLSLRRAQSVVRYLTKLGLDRQNLKAYGLGEALPKTKLKSKMDLNRRVNFFLLKSAQDKKKYLNFINQLDLLRETKMK